MGLNVNAIHCLSFNDPFIIFTGIHSITTVSEVSVKAGQSVSIPCLYNSKYRQHVKYLCKGQRWPSCSFAVKTNQQDSGRFLISDDRNQRIFTVTIKDLTGADTYYWCAVEIDGWTDQGVYFRLSVTTGQSQIHEIYKYYVKFRILHRETYRRLIGICFRLRSSQSLCGTSVDNRI